MNFKETLEKLSFSENLTREEAEHALDLIMEGNVEPEQIAGFLTAMRMKGETITELTGFVQVMRNKAVKVNVDVTNAIDLVGTGGDKTGTFNISTISAIVTAAAGVPVIKHGNRSASSKCGSADVLEQMGVVIELGHEAVEQVFNETGIAFMFAPMFHPAMRHVMPARRALGFRTFFNILGPMANPAGVKRYVIGAYNKDIAEKIAKILANLDTDFAFTFNSLDGLDEVSISAESEVFKLDGASLQPAERFTPELLGMKRFKIDDIMGGSVETNAQILQNILAGQATEAQTAITVLNSAFGIYASGTADSLQTAREMAEESLSSGKAAALFERFAAATRDVSNTRR